MKPDRIRYIRAELGESQVKFGERFGVAQNTIVRWEEVGSPNRGAQRLVEAELRRLEGVILRRKGARNGREARKETYPT